MKWDTSLLLTEQIRLEKDMHDGGVSRYRKTQERNLRDSPAETDWNRRLTKDLVMPLAAGIEAFIEHERGKGRGRISEAVPLLECLPASTAAMIFLKIALGGVEMKTGYTHIAVKVGAAIEDHVRFTRLEDAAPKYIKAVRASLKKAHSKKYEHQRNVMSVAESRLQSNTGAYAIDIDRWVSWDKQTKLKLGSVLTYIALQSLEFNGQPVFIKEMVGRDGEVLRLNPEVTEWIKEYSDFMECLAPEFAPCVVQPRDWVNPLNGGYYTPELNRTLPLVKVSRKKHMKHLTQQAMPEVYASINKLQSVQWEINRDLLAVINRINEYGGGFGLPSATPSIKPVNPVREDLANLKGSDLHAAMHPDELEEFQEWKHAMRDWYEAENTRVASLLSSIRTINAANLYSKYPCLHFVHTMDSRGRVYARSSTISPQGDDLQKALIRFHNGKALGARGRYWLAVQGANTWGNDKVSFDDRVSFIDSIEDDIRDIAADPVTFTQWLEADSPWQYLAWCLEWNALLEWEDQGRTAASFVSHLPIAQDGSCSGIQHYSGMLQDYRGGAAVNLTPSDKPKDIYGEVAEVLSGKLVKLSTTVDKVFKGKDGELTPAQVKRIADDWLALGINRNLTKRPVMVLPYGGTQASTHSYIEQYLSDLQVEENRLAKIQGRAANQAHPFRQHELGQETCTRLLTTLLWESIGEVVVAAREAMRCIQQVAFRVGKANLPLSWKTPLGFTVTQEIYIRDEQRVKTFFHGEMICRNVIREDSDSIDKYKMKSSSAPNFVHSMDASHLQSVVARSGLDSLACIHDSFGTHASDTDHLRTVLRREFVEQYQGRNIIEDFVLSVQESTGVDLTDVEIPELGSLDLNLVLQSPYLFG